MFFMMYLHVVGGLVEISDSGNVVLPGQPQHLTGVVWDSKHIVINFGHSCDLS